MGGDHDALGLRLELACGAKDDHAGVCAIGGDAELAAGLGHAEVGDDDVKGAVLELVDGTFDAVADGADVSGLSECLGHDLGERDLVFDDEDLCAEVVGLEVFGHGE